MNIQESNKLIAEFEGRLFNGHHISKFGGILVMRFLK